ncbi:hypothetical protein N0V93_005405 [Gnomoniopsis smithogilvyi]|uniref:Carboxypeptidase M14A n=1 Tax=Gnomoniopsis smithogilvyi TaxID=1191159 RepID=A0A9W8YUJ7_9PEZI|nr:hypothetical protein N0V93_005405 [Gnomoniopsis smithogilvyi]
MLCSKLSMVRIKHYAFLLASLDLSSAAKVSYDGFQVIRLPTGDNTETVNTVISSLNLSTWKYTQVFADVLVPPEQLDIFHEEVADLNVTIIDHDVGASIALETSSDLSTSSDTRSPPPLNESWFADYHAFAEHLDWMTDLQKKFQNNTEVIHLRVSNETTPIAGLHVFSGEPGTKPAVVLHGTVHAREWITTMVVEYVAYALLAQSSSDAHIRRLLKRYEFYLFPIVNPDGFIYSQTKDRMWRKTRQVNRRSKCIGVDMNRNWPYKWKTPHGSGTSPCDETYRGSRPGNSPEIKLLLKNLQDINEEHGIKLYIDFHSYSQVFLSPYGYTCDDLPDNHQQLQDLMKGAVSKIKEPFGTNFTYGPICSTMYQASGCSVDYVHETFPGVASMTVELRGDGFVVPAKEILPSGEEMFEGIKYILEHLK